MLSMRAFIGLHPRNLKSVTAPFQKAVRPFRYESLKVVDESWLQSQAPPQSVTELVSNHVLSTT